MNLLTIDTNVIMDIAGAIVILLFVIIAAFRGFLRILISLLGTIASVIAAILLRPIFFKMYDSFGLTAGIGDGISKGLESLSGTIADKISGMKMPGFLAEVLGNTDIASQSAESAFIQDTDSCRQDYLAGQITAVKSIFTYNERNSSVFDIQPLSEFRSPVKLVCRKSLFFDQRNGWIDRDSLKLCSIERPVTQRGNRRGNALQHTVLQIFAEIKTIYGRELRIIRP